MRRSVIWVAISLLTFAVGVLAASAWLADSPRVDSGAPEAAPPAGPRAEKQLRLVIPDETWEPIFFEPINERTTRGKLPELRKVALPSGDLEVRVWFGFGLSALEGLALRRSGDQWSAFHLEPTGPGLSGREQPRPLPAPKSGWDACWRRLSDAGIASLPDAAGAGCSALVSDGYSYVVELNIDRTYRTYMYGNPTYSKCAEAGRMIRIGEILREEFGLYQFDIKEYPQ